MAATHTDKTSISPSTSKLGRLGANTYLHEPSLDNLRQIKSITHTATVLKQSSTCSKSRNARPSSALSFRSRRSSGVKNLRFAEQTVIEIS
jgi:hypothetical protein